MLAIAKHKGCCCLSASLNLKDCRRRQLQCKCYASQSRHEALQASKVKGLQDEAAAIVARSKLCEDRYRKVSRLMKKVFVKERQQLIATEQLYLSTEDAVREQVSIADLKCSRSPTAVKAQSALLPAASEAASPPAAVAMLTETVVAETERLAVHIKALRNRRLQMSWAMSNSTPEALQQPQCAFKQPGVLEENLEEQAYDVILQMLKDIQRCNKQLCASTVRHAAKQIYKNKRRAGLLTALCSNEAQHQAVEVNQPDSPSKAARAAAAALGAHKAQTNVDEERALQYELLKYERLKGIRADELALYNRCTEEEVEVVFIFLHKMAMQLAVSEKTLSCLLKDLKQYEQVPSTSSQSTAGHGAN